VRVDIFLSSSLELLSSFHRHSVENYSNFAVLCTIREAGLGGFVASRATC
jgi:hypothetical protein